MKLRENPDNGQHFEAGGDRRWSRRSLLKKGGVAGVFGALFGSTTAVAIGTVNPEHEPLADAFAAFFQRHYRRMSKDEIEAALARLEREAKRRHKTELRVTNEPPRPGVVFGHALNLSRCKGTRKCVTGCVTENNQSRTPAIQFIRVVELDNGTTDLHQSEHFYDAEEVPRPGHYYLPIQCQQCENPPCVKNCPVGATWKEPDGIVVIDYNWCIGCRYCMAACPYWARHFNWGDPEIPASEINPRTHYLGNRPRYRGVVEKCTMCIQRTRVGRLPACVESCPTGARVFGDLMDPDSEIRFVLANKKVFRLKEHLGTEPKFWYYSD